MALCAVQTVVEALCPEAVKGIANCGYEYWAEICNEAMGHSTNELAASGYAVGLTLPTVVEGTRLRFREVELPLW
ncbi:MAG: hypothetical protein HRU17_03305 [Polyangiaceae bacterium]|nr:hypothetical protein [Polyangiaceae bacterium]